MKNAIFPLLAVAAFFLGGSTLHADTVTTVTHTFQGNVAFILYGDGSPVDLDDADDVAASDAAGAYLQNLLGLNWMTQDLAVEVSVDVPDSLPNLSSHWWHTNPDWGAINWIIASASDSISENGGLFTEKEFYGPTVLVWDDYPDNPSGVDRYTVNSQGEVINSPEIWYNFEIGLWENGDGATPPQTYNFGDASSISNYKPDVTGIYPGADGIRSYMTYTQGVLSEGSDAYWEHTFDTVLSFRDANNAAFMVGIEFNRDGSSPQPVPEPGTLGLICVGLAGMAWARSVHGRKRQEESRS